MHAQFDLQSEMLLIISDGSATGATEKAQLQPLCSANDLILFVRTCDNYPTNVI